MCVLGSRSDWNVQACVATNSNSSPLAYIHKWIYYTVNNNIHTHIHTLHTHFHTHTHTKPHTQNHTHRHIHPTHTPTHQGRRKHFWGGQARCLLCMQIHTIEYTMSYFTCYMTLQRVEARARFSEHWACLMLCTSQVIDLSRMPKCRVFPWWGSSADR
jgi:hypothetical protein